MALQSGLPASLPVEGMKGALQGASTRPRAQRGADQLPQGPGRTNLPAAKEALVMEAIKK